MKTTSTKLVRLQKYIADCGVTSRRKAEDLILENRVKVNGRTVNVLGTKVDPIEDSVMLNGEIIDSMRVDHRYIVLNKPRGYITTMHDPEGRKTIKDLIPVKERLFPVGRLDYLSEGLLLVTNDGELANMVMHPRFEVVKTYEVKVFGKVSLPVLKRLRDGIEAHDGSLKPLSVRIIKQLANKTWLEFRLSEGKNREIRRICEACDITIDKLKRVAIGGLSIDGIKPGSWEYINKKDLLRLVGLNKDGSKVKREISYVSMKKTVNPRKYSKIQKEAKVATDKAHDRYNKGSYYETLRIQKEAKELALSKKAEEGKKGVNFKPSFAKKNANPRRATR